MPKQDRIPELVEELRHSFADVPLVMEAADTIEDLMDVAEHYKKFYHEEHDLRMLAIKERNELKFENEILNDGVDDLKAEVKRLEEVRAQVPPSLWTDEPIEGSEFMTHNQGGRGFEIHFRTDSAEKYKAVQDECRRQIGHAKPEQPKEVQDV